MFGTLRYKLLNVIALDEDKIIRDIVSNSGLQQDIIDLNREDQLYDKGIDADGNLVGDGRYSKMTIQHKIETGERYDHVTLKDTGEFYESFKIKKGEAEIIITADTIKDGKDLASIYGEKILGLTAENVAILRGWIKKLFIERTRALINT